MAAEGYFLGHPRTNQARAQSFRLEPAQTFFTRATSSLRPNHAQFSASTLSWAALLRPAGGMACATVVCVEKEAPCGPSSEVRGREGGLEGRGWVAVARAPQRRPAQAAAAPLPIKQSSACETGRTGQ